MLRSKHQSSLHLSQTSSLPYLKVYTSLVAIFNPTQPNFNTTHFPPGYRISAFLIETTSSVFNVIHAITNNINSADLAPATLPPPSLIVCCYAFKDPAPSICFLTPYYSRPLIYTLDSRALISVVCSSARITLCLPSKIVEHLCAQSPYR